MEFISERTEPFDLLRPSAQRSFRDVSGEWALCPTICDHTYTVQTKKCDTSFDKRTLLSDAFAKGNKSASSLISKKTSEICKKCSVLSYTNLQHSCNHNQPALPRSSQTLAHKERPVIRVTVIPNNSSNFYYKSRKRRRQHTNKVKSSVSNEENSIKASNVHLVVTGRKRENIYEIKATGSAELSSNQTNKVEDDTVEENLKDLIKSLNMDKKKRGGKNKASTEEDADENDEGVFKSTAHFPKPNRNRESHEIYMPDCYCPQSSRKVASTDMKDHRSRVKIVGRIGLDHDDKYILDCAATVDNEPIETNIQGNFDEQHMERIGRLEHESRKRVQRDFVMQADIGNSSGPIAVQFSSVGTQVTPANFNYVCFSNIEKVQIASNPNQTLYLTNPMQPLHCNCNSNRNINNIPDYESVNQTPSCSSPLVIISVYSKHDDIEKGSDQDTGENKCSDSCKSKSPTRKTNAGNKNLARRGKQNPENNSKNNIRSPRYPGTPRSLRSSSPAQGTSTPVKIPPKLKTEVKQTETKGQKQRNIKGPPGAERNANQNLKQSQKSKTMRDTSPTSLKLSTITSRSVSNKQQNDQSIRKTGKYQSGKNRLTEDPAVTKKAIVDAYTKKVTDQLILRQPKAGLGISNDISNVAVNIDSERKYYDVIFHQGNRTTDLRVRTTMKNQSSQKSYIDVDAGASDSLENFYYMQDDERRTVDLTDDAGMRPSSSRLNAIARDSIEICHRRETSSFQKNNMSDSSHTTISNHSSNNNFNEVHAPVKHFKGDDPLPNPIERDKEIRQLLGVANRIPSFSWHSGAGTQVPDFKDKGKSLRCFANFGEIKVSSEIKGIITKLCPVEQQPFGKDALTDIRKIESFKETSSDKNEPAKNNEKTLNSPGSQKEPTTCTNMNTKYEHCAKGEKYGDPTSIYQQMILSHNINVYFQIKGKKRTKEKPIVLTHAQYGKLKRTIESKIAKKGLKICKIPSYVSVGEGKRKSAKKLLNKSDAAKTHKPVHDKELLKINTEDHELNILVKEENMRGSCDTESSEKKYKQSVYKINIDGTRSEPIKEGMWTTSGARQVLNSCPNCRQLDFRMCVHSGMYKCVPQNTCKNCGFVERKSNSKKHKFNDYEHAVSSTEVCYTNILHRKQDTISSTSIKAKSEVPSNIADKKSVTFHTIFNKRHKILRTSNIKTSKLSIFSHSDVQFYKDARTEKPRKPFLNRLLSCLKPTMLKDTQKPMNNIRSVQSSIDSYHFSSSYAAADLGSSLYDTSASYYTNHSVCPINSKHIKKKGLLSSVRGLFSRVT